MTQSAVSRQIQALEEEVGVALFLRHTRAVELTHAGGILLRAVTPSLERIRFSEALARAVLVAVDESGHLIAVVADPRVLVMAAQRYWKAWAPLALALASSTAKPLDHVSPRSGDPDPPDRGDRKSVV